jgi:hypothetical protein
LFDTTIRYHRGSSSSQYYRNRASSNASIYDNIIVPITNGHVS